MSGAPGAASSSPNSRSTSAGLLASQANARALVACTRDARSSGERAASDTARPSCAKARASEALRPEPAPTMRACLKSRLGMAFRLLTDGDGQASALNAKFQQTFASSTVRKLEPGYAVSCCATKTSYGGDANDERERHVREF